MAKSLIVLQVEQIPSASPEVFDFVKPDPQEIEYAVVEKTVRTIRSVKLRIACFSYSRLPSNFPLDLRESLDNFFRVKLNDFQESLSL
ncbi:MAG: hypothetical protein GWP45_00830 [Proteobacteria bacterium]|jgi:hypothetical protein|nr:hypothetical protein [Pseudomonadota bacterium]